jgi:hypothetical protein
MPGVLVASVNLRFHCVVSTDIRICENVRFRFVLFFWEIKQIYINFISENRWTFILWTSLLYIKGKWSRYVVLYKSQTYCPYILKKKCKIYISFFASYKSQITKHYTVNNMLLQDIWHFILFFSLNVTFPTFWVDTSVKTERKRNFEEVRYHVIIVTPDSK